MACAKPPDFAATTPPLAVRHPERRDSAQKIAELARAAEAARPGASLDQLISRAEFVRNQALREGASPELLALLDRRLEGLRAHGRHLLRDALEARFGAFGDRKPSAASRANVESAIRALTDKRHWASDQMRTDLLEMFERNGRIPQEYKGQFPHDVATVLLMAPHAGGLVRELTLRGQRGATGSASKLGSNSNAAVGAAYEIMGTAALGRSVSQPVNAGAPALHIRTGQDVVTFGDKSHLNRRSNDGVTWRSPSRLTIECDVRVGRGTEEIGIDFKHTKEGGVKYANKDFRNQVENVVWALKEGQVTQFHFVSNGTFGDSVKEVVAQANAELRAHDCAPIGLHEVVHTVLNDPASASGGP